MNRCLFLLLAIGLSGCVPPTEPQPSAPVRPQTNLFGDQYRSPIPDAPYDGIFSSTMYLDEFVDSRGKDSTSITYISRPWLYNRLGDRILPILYQDSVEVDSVLISHSPSLDLNFPSPVTWSMKGDSYFPAFLHTIRSEAVPSILSPPILDSIDADSLVHLTYSAPGADTVEFSATYVGKAHRLGNPPDSLSFAAESNDYISANTGHITLLPFTLDTAYYTSFKPELLEVNMAWARGDTIHVGNKIFGFVTEVSLSRPIFLK